MRNSLKTKKVFIKSLGEDLVIRELSYAEHNEVVDPENKDKVGQLVCKYGVPEFAGESIEDIGKNLSVAVVSEITVAVFGLMGVEDVKNSESVPDGDSHSD